MGRQSYPTKTVLSIKFTRNRIVLSFKDSPRKPLGRRPNKGVHGLFDHRFSDILNESPVSVKRKRNLSRAHGFCHRFFVAKHQFNAGKLVSALSFFPSRYWMDIKKLHKRLFCIPQFIGVTGLPAYSDSAGTAK